MTTEEINKLATEYAIERVRGLSEFDMSDLAESVMDNGHDPEDEEWDEIYDTAKDLLRQAAAGVIERLA